MTACMELVFVTLQPRGTVAMDYRGPESVTCLALKAVTTNIVWGGVWVLWNLGRSFPDSEEMNG